MRSDAQRNRKRLLEATGEMLRTDPENVSVPVIAKRAGLSTATAYRYFPSLDELLNTYLHDVIVELRDYSHDCPKTGSSLFKDVVHEWGRLLSVYGTAMIQLRAREGFLERLRAGDKVISTVRDAWERPIRSIMRKLDVPDEQFDYALFLYNIVFDPREVLDLVGQGFAVDDALDRLIATYYGALRGWAADL
ncbi:TetR/AcrR family transcriptional regulator [Streptomyces sp. NRRL B-3229]|uniref:TetR/AcrR family transcriptional regulator n=1 Tax=Streptomyces sp. NRRL B-3229 TaxID=1463836 RepID=UPI000A547EED|nr:TetR/AcrR family transcriptional regulator [Streptomyces sp. NRRL B-3229]